MSESLSKEKREKLEKLGYAVDLLEADESRIREYDFKMPRRFTKENMRLLNTVYDCFAKMLANKLTGVLRTSVQVDLLAIKELAYSEFSKGKESQFVFPVIDTKLKENNEYISDSFVMAVPSPLMYSIINKLLGGDDEARNEHREFTSLELSLIKNFVVSNVAPIAEVVWSGYIDLLTSCESISLIPEVSRRFVPTTQVLVTQFELTMFETNQIIELCMPVELVESIFSNLGNRFMGLEDSDKIKQKKSLMLEHVKESAVNVSAVLGKTELELADILALQFGDVLMLDSFTDSLVKVMVKEKEWFLGKVGTYRGRRSIKITETL